MRNRENLKSFLLVFVIVILPFSLAHFAEAQSLGELLTKAEVFLNEGNQLEAEHYFYAARDLALKEDSWPEVIRTGDGFAALGNSEEAIQSWLIAGDIAWRQESWEGALEAGQGLAMIGNYDQAYETICMAENIARKRRDWEGALGAGQGLAMIRNYDEAERLYEEAESIAAKEGKEATDRLGKRMKFFTNTLLIRTIGELEPGLAESWEFTADGKVVMFLKRGIKFFNGDQFNADSVVAAFERNQIKWNRLEIQSVEWMGEYKVQISPVDSHSLWTLSEREISIQGP